MNRPFEYRVWEKVDKRFYYQEETDEPNDFIWASRDDAGDLIEGITEFNVFLRCPKRYVIQQWTGLFDSKGKKIFEGDIVNGCIPFNDIKNQLVIYGSKKNFYQGAFILRLEGTLLCHVKKLVVVGNMFENPKLLS